MAKMDIALDLGTSFTSIFVSGNGIVLREPSVIAYFDDGSRRRTRAVGAEAYEMMGRAPEKTKIVCPIVDGAIKDADACADMLGEFMKKILPESYVFKPRVNCILGVPIGISVDERRAYEEVLMRAGIDEITMINNVMLAGIGVELPVSSAFGGVVVSIGGGATEVAIISLCGIKSGCGVTIGGDMIDHALMDRISGAYQLGIGRSTARRIKEEVCSLIRNDCAQTTVSGMDMETRNIRTATVSSAELFDVVYEYYKNIIEAVENVLNTCTPTIAAEIQRYGISVVGGGSEMPGLAEVMTKRLGLRVTVSPDARYATVFGGGKLLSDRPLLDDILAHA
ncbi:MAG: Hsp70 family protein [Clostridiales bacterium]|nr:Hsp70 family protein [Clostridiales bacterium]